jgi:HK97 gp10 family phage protein
MDVQIEGMRGLEAKLNDLVKDINQAGSRGMQAVGMEIVAEAKQNLRRNRTTNTGALSSSGKVQKQSDGTVDAGFFSTDSAEGYAAAVEYGRGPSRRRGAIPLRDTLKAWVRRKLGGRAMRSAAVFIKLLSEDGVAARLSYKASKKSEEELIESTALLIACKIYKHGTKPQPFFTPAVEKVQQKLEDIMSEHINEATK